MSGSLCVRSVLAVLLTALAALGLTTSASAGGWAVTSIDSASLPNDGYVAGETYRIGYTIRQHGHTPIAVSGTAIRLISPKAPLGAPPTPYEFVGVPEGPLGHYVATVTFPVDGDWLWEVTQGPFAPQSLGMVTVRPATPRQAAPPPPTAMPASNPSVRATLAPPSPGGAEPLTAFVWLALLPLLTFGAGVLRLSAVRRA